MPGSLAMDSAIEASGSLPISSEETCSIIDELDFLAVTASSIPLRMPVTTTSCSGGSDGAELATSAACEWAIVADDNRMLMTVARMPTAERRTDRPGLCVFKVSTRLPPRNPVGAPSLRLWRVNTHLSHAVPSGNGLHTYSFLSPRTGTTVATCLT